MPKSIWTIVLFILSFPIWAVTEQQCRTQLAQISGQSVNSFEYICSNEEARSQFREIANCLTMFKGGGLDNDTYRNYCVQNNGQLQDRQAVFTCMRAANASNGAATLHHVAPSTTLQLCQDANVRGQFNQVVTCVATGSPLFDIPGRNNEPFMWGLIDVCKQGGQEAVPKVKTCTTSLLAKFLQIIPEGNHEGGHTPDVFETCSKPEVYNNLSAILSCQDRVGQSVRRLLDQKLASYTASHNEPDSFYYDLASGKGADALNACATNANLKAQPQEVMTCVDAIAAATERDILQTYEANRNGFLSVSIQGSYFDLHLERCATDELRQFQTQVLACMSRVGHRVPQTDQALAGGSYLYCEMFTAASSGLQTRAPAFLPVNCPDSK